MPLTKISDYEKRHAVWKNSIASTEKHIQLSQVLINNGIKLFQEIEQVNDIEKSLLLLQKAAFCIEKGTKLERESRDKLMALYNEEPKAKT